VTRVVWEGEVPWNAEALLRATAAGEEERSVLGEARAWLRQVLADGPRPARELVAEARTMGIALRTYHAARKAEGVIARKEQTANGPWIVMLPESPRQDR
jgi:putative DNA primase/helicase